MLFQKSEKGCLNVEKNNRKTLTKINAYRGVHIN